MRGEVTEDFHDMYPLPWLELKCDQNTYIAISEAVQKYLHMTSNNENWSKLLPVIFEQTVVDLTDASDRKNCACCGGRASKREIQRSLSSEITKFIKKKLKR